MDKRHLEENFFKALMIASTLIVLGALALILATVFLKGLPAVNWAMLTQTPKGGYYIGKEGGILNAITGSIVLSLCATFIALVISLPIVFYLNVYLKKQSRLALVIRFLFDVLYGIPAIVYGALGFTLMIFLGLKTSLLAGIIAISFLVVPIVARGIDEVLKMIPFELKEASLAMGTTRLEILMQIIFRQALPGIITAVLLGFGRAVGDAAAVMFTAGFTDSLPTSLFKPVATLPLAIFFQLATPFPEVQQRGYASAFILTILILSVSFSTRFLSKRFTKNIVK